MLSTTPDCDRLHQRAAVLKALAHPTRLWLVEQLQQQERCVCELMEEVDADISTVSKHLAVLKQVGLVTVRRQGKQRYYRLTTPCLMSMFHCIERVLDHRSPLTKQEEAS
ncbi:transcriptional regulator, ArsR family [Ferrimonas sediminum]|uniref:Transcriptional regulator, ArsR family n=1 Tax=Ferrimonas sediminum TaxID=718193 RepID=A0A1G8KLN0_9GAMM|nr:metalloregulator ArsR/SmtB family transcription factor [Ferrimonas sediminum]SDI44309.1 transcriptional regulator, ArsR family [Ferrimonas sediminum]